MKKYIIYILFMVIGGTSFGVNGYCDLFNKKSDKKSTEPVLVTTESPAEDLAPIPQKPLAKTAGESKPEAAPAVDPRILQIPGKLQAIESQQKSLTILESRMASEKKQLDEMQKDFALNFKVDLQKLKAGKVRWDDKKKALLTD